MRRLRGSHSAAAALSWAQRFHSTVVVVGGGSRSFGGMRLRAMLTAPSSSASPTLVATFNPAAAACSVMVFQQRRLQSTTQSDDDGVPNAMPMHEDLYARLGLTRGCDKNEIKTNYRKLAKKYHPDHNIGNKEAEEFFKRVTAAYEILSDGDKRRHYDATGRPPGGAGGPGGFHARTYAYHYRSTQPLRFYVGLFATTWIVVMSINWFAAGSFLNNVWTFLVILATLTFLGRMPAACIIFYLYAPSTKGPVSSKGPGLRDGSTVLLTTHSAPDPKIRPTRVVRLTAIDRTVLQRGGYVKYTCRWDGGGEPAYVSSRPGDASAILPPVVNDIGLHITAELIDANQQVMGSTFVDLSA